MSNARINLFWVLVFAVTLPAGVIVSTKIATRSFERVKIRDQTITVKGYGERQIRSDLAIWSSTITVRNVKLPDAYTKLEGDRARLIDTMKQSGFPPDKIDQTAVRITMRYKLDDEGHATNQIEHYVLSQTFSVSSGEVERIARAAREVSSLIKEDIELTSSDPEYLYTKLNDVKLQMLAEATANARQRAEQLVANSQSALGPLRSASQGVFQITPVYSTEVSGEGENDTSSMEKSIKAVVTIEYAIQ